ncbi:MULTISPECIES: hypothetical protein [unclassified Rathayibacter]|uniref:hypothetical protein n=1 Tax=unclassified Rathayibacter TaxID=2609250 RepID=UPI00188C9DD0|nr:MULTISPECIES: hypothetical protein [unclassified Rathayibacter]MBF4463094.1 hypothetical protein [Rathayibacter sp. VKM Ac-2879]MBF4504669.1 hypothetical protein [Rathayibacter sp. VKM Ac-2878]
MDAMTRVDMCAEAWRTDPQDAAAKQALLSAAQELPAWAFLVRGPDDGPTPCIGRVGEDRVVFVFTSVERARAGALDLGFTSDKGWRVLTLPQPAASDWVASMAQIAVVGAVFDRPLFGWTASLEALAATSGDPRPDPSS